MSYIGNTPAENYASFLTETFSVSATANYTLSHAVSNENDIRLVINNVVQQPGSGKAYTASGTTLTLTSATSSGDVMYAVYLGRALQTVNPPNASVGTAQLADSSVTSAKLASGVGGVAGITSSADATAMTITSAEKIGIGETSPLALVHIKQADSGQGTVSADTSQLVIEDDSTAGITLLGGSSGTGAIFFGDSGDNDAGLLEYDHGGNTMIFKTGAVQRLKLGTEVAVNDDAVNTGAAVFKVKGAQSNDVAIFVHKNTSGNENLLRFRDGDQTTCGTISINTDSNTVAYNTSSDYRLKENVVYDFDATTRLKQLKPARFNFISDPNQTIDGFLAHETMAVVPESVQGEKDGFEKYREGDNIPEEKNIGDFKLDEDGNKIPNYQGIDQSKLVPLLVKTIQELEARITTLENA